MAIRAELSAAADDLFAAFSDVMETITIYTPGAYNPATGVKAADTSATFTGYVRDYDAGQIDGNQIQVGDRRILGANLSSASITPKSGQHAAVNSVRYEIIRVSDPGTDGILTEIQIRGVN